MQYIGFEIKYVLPESFCSKMSFWSTISLVDNEEEPQPKIWVVHCLLPSDYFHSFQ
jgi:hypothetical protein